MARLSLTDADLRMLRAIFDAARREGRMTGARHDYAVMTLTLARRNRDREPELLAERSMG